MEQVLAAPPRPRARILIRLGMTQGSRRAMGQRKLGVSCVRSAPRLESHPSPAVDATHSRSSIVRLASGPEISARRLLGPKKNSN